MKTLTKRGAPVAEPNPFLPTVARETVDPTEAEKDPLFGDAVTLDGPPQPLGIPVSPADVAVLPARTVTTTPVLWVVGLHGGSGATTVTSLLGEGAQEAGRCWPVPGAKTPQQPARAAAPILLVARTHAAGLDLAATAARSWASGQLGVALLGLVLVDDGPRLPKDLVAGCKRLSGMTPHCWHLSWRESWRSQLQPSADALPYRVRRTANAIRTQASQAQVITLEGPTT